MKKTIIALSLCTLAIFSMQNITFAQETQKPCVDRPAFNGQPPAFDKEKMKQMHQKHKQEIIKRLNLTKEQQAKADALHEQGRKEIEPIMQKMKALKEQLKTLRDSCATREDFKAKAEGTKNELKSLKKQAEAIREKHIQQFEAILTPAQKVEFQKIKAEMKQKREQMKKQWKERKGKQGGFSHERDEFPTPPPEMN